MVRLLDKFPTFNPEWPKDTQDKWFDGFDTLAKKLETRRGGKTTPHKE